MDLMEASKKERLSREDAATLADGDRDRCHPSLNGGCRTATRARSMPAHLWPSRWRNGSRTSSARLGRMRRPAHLRVHGCAASPRPL